MPTYRLYYNARAAFPRVWSVDDGDQQQEVTVTRVDVGICPWRTRALSPAARQRLDPAAVPTAWIEVTGTLHLRDGRAYFSPTV